jgi:hypothetical protein
MFFFYNNTSRNDAKSEAAWDQLAAEAKVSHPLHQMMFIGQQEALFQLPVKTLLIARED